MFNQESCFSWSIHRVLDLWTCRITFYKAVTWHYSIREVARLIILTQTLFLFKRFCFFVILKNTPPVIIYIPLKNFIFLRLLSNDWQVPIKQFWLYFPSSSNLLWGWMDYMKHIISITDSQSFQFDERTNDHNHQFLIHRDV